MSKRTAREFEWYFGGETCSAGRVIRIGNQKIIDVKLIENQITHEVLHCLIREALGIEAYVKIPKDVREKIVMEMNPLLLIFKDDRIIVLTGEEARGFSGDE